MSYLDVDLKWWGVNIKMSHQAVQDMNNGLLGLTGVTGGVGGGVAVAAQGGLVTLLGSSSAIAAPVAAIIAAGFIIKRSEFSLMDRGSGVQVPITWVHVPAIGSTGPAGAALLIHPFPK